MKGMRKRVTIGFLSIIGLLFASGMISLVELNILSNTTERVLVSNKQNATFARDMLDASYDHNVALISHTIIDNSAGYDSICISSLNRMESTLVMAQDNLQDKKSLDSLAVAIVKLRIFTHRSLEEVKTSGDSLNCHNTKIHSSEYQDLNRRITTYIKDYMLSSHDSIAPQAEQVRIDAYRAVTPVLISLFVMIAIVLMFYLFMITYEVKPIIAMNKALGSYLQYKIPFKFKEECKDEILELREKIETLIYISKQNKG